MQDRWLSGPNKELATQARRRWKEEIRTSGPLEPSDAIRLGTSYIAAMADEMFFLENFFSSSLIERLNPTDNVATLQGKRTRFTNAVMDAKQGRHEGTQACLREQAELERQSATFSRIHSESPVEHEELARKLLAVAAALPVEGEPFVPQDPLIV